MVPAPNNARAFHAFALDLAARGALVLAEEAVRFSLKLDDRPAAPWALLGAIRARSRDHRGAIAHYLEAVRRDPKDIAAWSDLGELYVANLQLDLAADAFERVITLDPNATHPSGLRARMVVAKTIKSLQAK